jgi:formate dehydrogenase iron-sulfur subunit
MNAAILNDLTMCAGCEACVYACKEINELPSETPAQELSANAWTVVKEIEGHPVRQQCFHCIEPTCVSVCPVAALQKSEDGPVFYLSERCMGCRYCMAACPFQIPRYQWDSPVPIVQKCIMCNENKIEKGEEPACTSVCPTGATEFFQERDDALAEARKRIAENPATYQNYIYGEKEAGGTNVFYLAPKDKTFEELGFKWDIRKENYPELSWEVLEKLPPVISTLGVTMTGIWWITHRREKVEKREQNIAKEKAKANKAKGGEDK